ncbi:MAG TPA: DUF4837 family protein [Bacteroidales bacterium]|nr:DUF4837 family protein [Bacteroidales bacterium]HOH22097.1 DUF4837 family protein [Bacteroidales bacterium]HPB57059.1 DUF4837 family protein [Bacteroidales bacterium]HPZ03442.1 DUF4837 family protein [Bacteroidales bacterium]HQB74779.1 DUF4837 family protein [Bacteroidales bacterium]
MKTIKKNLILLAVLIILLAGGCRKKAGSGFKVENYSNGKAGEIVLVMDPKQYTESERKEIISILQQPQPAINQVEPMFDVLKFGLEDFNAFYRKHRSIVYFEITDSYDKPSINFEENVWASPQVYITIKGNHVDSTLALFRQHQDEIIEKLYENDLKRLQAFNIKNNSPQIEKTIKEKFGISLTIPQQYFIAREEPDFLWLRYKTVKNDRFIMIFKSDDLLLSKERLVETRNQMTKNYIPGAIRGAYPILSDIYEYPEYREIAIKSKKGVEMRGLWESVGDNMGGPFYSFSFINSDQTAVITIDGFVYAPQEDKRDYLREVESIVKSLR